MTACCASSARAHVPDAPAVLGDDLDACTWFMDHRNADGSHAEMCGNGIRLFLHVLVSEGLLDRPRAGPASSSAPAADPAGSGPPATATTGSTWGRPGRSARAPPALAAAAFPGSAVSMGNPHLVCLTDAISTRSISRSRRRSTRRCSRTASTSSS